MSSSAFQPDETVPESPAEKLEPKTGRRAGHTHTWVRQRNSKFMEDGVAKVMYQCSGCHVRRSARASATLSDG